MTTDLTTAERELAEALRIHSDCNPTLQQLAAAIQLATAPDIIRTYELARREREREKTSQPQEHA